MENKKQEKIAEVFVVRRTSKIEYDFSVETVFYGCFKSKERAVALAKKEFEKLVQKYKEEEGLEVEQDYSFQYNRAIATLCFGEEEDFERHTVSIDIVKFID